MKSEHKGLSSPKALFAHTPVIKLHSPELMPVVVLAYQQRVTLILGLLCEGDAGTAMLRHPVQQLPVATAVRGVKMLCQVGKLMI